MNSSGRPPTQYPLFFGWIRRFFGNSAVVGGLLLLIAGCWHRLPEVEPATLMPTLPTPYTRPESGTFTYGTTIRFATDSLPTGVSIEYSADDGQHWQTADSMALQSATRLQLRSRRGPYVSAASVTPFGVRFKRVLLVGNSITLHAPESEIGWTGNWGMAASAPANDYVHKLTPLFQALDSSVAIQIYDGVPFERQFWTFNYRDVRLVAAFKPDLVVMRIGENAPTASVNSRNFKLYYQRLIDSLTVNYAPVKVVCTTSFFDQPATSDIIRQVATERTYFLADLYGLVNNSSYQAIGQFKNAAVASHPNDKGMQAIANLIWDKVH